MLSWNAPNFTSDGTSSDVLVNTFPRGGPSLPANYGGQLMEWKAARLWGQTDVCVQMQGPPLTGWITLSGALTVAEWAVMELVDLRPLPVIR